MRLTTIISVTLLVAIDAALIIYAYASWSGAVTVAGWTLVLLAALSVAAFLVARLIRRPLRFDFVPVFAAAGVILISLEQIRTTSEADSFIAALEAAEETGEEDLVELINATPTDPGVLIAAALSVRAQTNSEIEFLYDGFGVDEIVAIVTGPDAVDDSRLAVAISLADELATAINRARDNAMTRFDTAEADLLGIETGLPDAQRLSVVQAVQELITSDRQTFIHRLELVEQRIAAAQRAATALTTFTGAYRYDAEERAVKFMPSGAVEVGTAQQYGRSIESIEQIDDELAALASQQGALSDQDILALAESLRQNPE
jgi:hypothetical protein